jgi:uncharacterized protein
VPVALPAPARRPPPLPIPVEGRRPPFALVVVLLVLFAVPSIVYAVRGLPHQSAQQMLTGGFLWLELLGVLVVGAVVLVGRYRKSVGWIPRQGVRRAVQGIAVALIVTSVVLVTTSAAQVGWGPTQVGVLVANVLFIGVLEETLYRGLLWASLPARWSAARLLLVTSVVFGAVHVMNGLVTGSWTGSILQAGIAALLGLGLGALRMRTGWLGLGILTHAAIDGGVGAAGLVAPRLADLHPTPALLVLSLLVFEALYVTLAVTGVVVLIRTAITERRARRLAQQP